MLEGHKTVSIKKLGGEDHVLTMESSGNARGKSPDSESTEQLCVGIDLILR